MLEHVSYNKLSRYHISVAGKGLPGYLDVIDGEEDRLQSSAHIVGDDVRQEGVRLTGHARAAVLQGVTWERSLL